MCLKRLVGIFVCSIVLAGSIGQAYAVSNDNTDLLQDRVISPQMTYISDAGSYITITSAGQAMVECYVLGNSSTVTKVNIKAELQQFTNGKWTTIETWTTSSNSYKVTLAKSRQVSKGYSYRVVGNFTDYSGSNSESQVVKSSESRY
ncbi:hypothetical protein [Tissierella praeacuta]|uniref:hypothetical protein n=1 Tax=Tissierella praeacuta TaxID=43131 RepID=UPI00333F1EDA